MAKRSTEILDEKNIELRDFWSNIFHVFFRDFKRLITNPISVIVMLFVLVFPSLYAWIGTNAYWDPYSNTSGLKIAIINEDEPADTGIAGEIDLGKMLVDALKDMPILGWDFTNREDAMQKLDTGDVYSAIVIPKNFSESFANLFKNPENRTYVRFDYYINERENGAAVKIFDIGASTIEEQINERFIQTVSNILADKVHEITGDVSSRATGAAKNIADKVDGCANSINNLNHILESGDNTIEQVKSSISSSKKLVADVRRNVNDVIDVCSRVNTTCSNIRIRVQNSIDDLERRGVDLKIIKEILTNLEKSIDENLNAISKINELMYKINSICEQLDTLTSQIDSILNTTDKLGDNVGIKLNEVYDKLHDLAGVIDGDMAAAPFALKTLIDSNTENLGTFMSTPVQFDNHIINEVKLYGLGAAPFFSCLTLWIAGLVLIALLRTEVDPPKRKGFNTHQAYISRAMLFAFVAMLQGLVCAVGDFAIGVTCDNYLLFVLTCIISSFTFTSIIYMLAACFKHVGKAIAVVLIIMQIPGSSGMFPVAMMPESYQAISPLLPFTYAISALREAIVSPDYVRWIWDIAILLIFVFLSLIIGVYARKHLASLNKLFDKKLAKTGLMECDNKDHIENKYDYSDFAIAMETSVDDSKIITNLEQLKLKYKEKKRNAAIFLWAFPCLLLTAFSIVFYFVNVDINTKILILMVWLLVIIACSSYVIVLNFKHNRIKKELKEITIIEKKKNNLGFVSSIGSVNFDAWG